MSTTLFFIDSFDHYSTAQLLRKWTTGTGNIVAGRTGNGLQITGTGPMKTLNAVEQVTLTAGWAYKTTQFSNYIIGFLNTINGIRVELEHVGDGRFRFRYFAADGSALGPTVSLPTMNTGEWYYVEMTATVSYSGGILTYTAEARINEAVILTETYNLTTGSSYSTHVAFASVQAGAPGGGNTAIIDDVYVTDNEYLGDIKIAVLYPNAAGDSSTWTPSTAGANYLMIKEHPADDDTTTIAAATTGLVDQHNLDDIVGFTGTIKGAQALWLTKKSDTGTGAIKGQWKSGGTVHETTEFHPSNLSYIYLIDPERQSFFTSADWTVSEINALQLGIKRTQ